MSQRVTVVQALAHTPAFGLVLAATTSALNTTAAGNGLGRGFFVARGKGLGGVGQPEEEVVGVDDGGLGYLRAAARPFAGGKRGQRGRVGAHVGRLLERAHQVLARRRGSRPSCPPPTSPPWPKQRGGHLHHGQRRACRWRRRIRPGRPPRRRPAPPPRCRAPARAPPWPPTASPATSSDFDVLARRHHDVGSRGIAAGSERFLRPGRRYSGATLPSAITNEALRLRRASAGSAARRCAPSPPSTPAPMRTS